MKSFGYDGIEIACWGDHLEPQKAVSDPAYVAGRKAALAAHGLKCWAVSGHLIGQCGGDLWDPRLDGFAPNRLAGKPEEIREWAVAEMKLIAGAAKNMGVTVVNGFMGSPVWKYWYSFPQTSEEMIRPLRTLCGSGPPFLTSLTVWASVLPWRYTPRK